MTRRLVALAVLLAVAAGCDAKECREMCAPRPVLTLSITTGCVCSSAPAASDGGR